MKSIHRELKLTHSFTKEWVTATRRQLLTGALLSLVCVPLMMFQPRVVLVVELMAAMAILGLTLRCYDPFKGTDAELGSISRDLARAVREGLAECRTMRWLMLFPALLAGSLVVALWGYEPTLRELGVFSAWNGAFFALFNGLAFLGTFLASERSSRSRVSWQVLFLTACGVSGMGIASGAFVLVLILMQQLARGWYLPFFEGLLQERCREERGATFSSLQSLLARAAMAGALLLATLVEALSSGAMAYIAVAGVGFILGAVLVMSTFRHKGCDHEAR